MDTGTEVKGFNHYTACTKYHKYSTNRMALDFGEAPGRTITELMASKYIFQKKNMQVIYTSIKR